MYRSIFLLIAFMLLSAGIFSGCGQDSDVLTPDQIDISMIDQIVKVKGKITFAVENPMGVGGMYMKLGNDKGEVDVRIQPELWDRYQVDEKTRFKKGKTVTVEGILSKAGTELVVVHGKFTSANTTETSDTSTR